MRALQSLWFLEDIIIEYMLLQLELSILHHRKYMLISDYLYQLSLCFIRIIVTLLKIKLFCY
jgi:hypothetical protein